MKPSEAPMMVFCVEVDPMPFQFGLLVPPATHTFPLRSSTMPVARSEPGPPRKVDHSTARPSARSLLTNTSVYPPPLTDCADATPTPGNVEESAAPVT